MFRTRTRQITLAAITTGTAATGGGLFYFLRQQKQNANKEQQAAANEQQQSASNEQQQQQQQQQVAANEQQHQQAAANEQQHHDDDDDDLRITTIAGEDTDDNVEFLSLTKPEIKDRYDRLAELIKKNKAERKKLKAMKKEQQKKKEEEEDEDYGLEENPYTGNVRRTSPAVDEDQLLKEAQRKILMSRASGKVLEVGVGKGTNFNCYDPRKIESLTMVDFSPGMLELAKRRLSKSPIGQDSRIPITFLTIDIEDMKEIPDDSFDTIVDSFNLCTYSDPVQALDEMARVCKDKGRILLLEHGLTPDHDAARLQEAQARRDYKELGCVNNRDILGLVMQSALHPIRGRNNNNNSNSNISTIQNINNDNDNNATTTTTTAAAAAAAAAAADATTPNSRPPTSKYRFVDALRFGSSKSLFSIELEVNKNDTGATEQDMLQQLVELEMRREQEEEQAKQQQQHCGC